jgi:hypothetical protein
MSAARIAREGRLGAGGAAPHLAPGGFVGHPGVGIAGRPRGRPSPSRRGRPLRPSAASQSPDGIFRDVVDSVELLPFRPHDDLGVPRGRDPEKARRLGDGQAEPRDEMDCLLRLHGGDLAPVTVSRTSLTLPRWSVKRREVGRGPSATEMASLTHGGGAPVEDSGRRAEGRPAAPADASLFSPSCRDSVGLIRLIPLSQQRPQYTCRPRAMRRPKWARIVAVSCHGRGTRPTRALWPVQG